MSCRWPRQGIVEIGCAEGGVTGIVQSTLCHLLLSPLLFWGCSSRLLPLRASLSQAFLYSQNGAGPLSL